MVESAWAGGATPIVVVSADDAGQVAAALAGSPAVLAEPAPSSSGLLAQVRRGVSVATERVRETDGALVWPSEMVWVDAETVTTLIEAHGANRQSLLRPRYGEQPGWPVLVPMSLLPELREGIFDELTAAGVPLREIDTGDPGTVFDERTPIDDLPDYEGPAEPVTGPPPEWGAAAADTSEETPLQGPALAPYGQAAEHEE
jgi:CTP:molybdopterin cytidylyltransferase MocA